MALALGALAIAFLAGAPALAQAPVPLEGNVLKAGTKDPVEGATVDIYRTDIKAKYTTKTDKKGNFSYPVPQQGTYTVIVSGPGLAPQFQPNVHATGSVLGFQMPTGAGQHPTLEDVEKALKGGGGGDDAEANEARRKAEEEHEKQVAEKAKFDARKLRFDAGIAAMNNKDYNTAITELTAAVDGLEGADPAFFSELASVGGTNLAETQYRVAVDLYNNKQKDEAKQHLQAAAKAIKLALTFNQANQSSFAIQGKVLLLLVDRFQDVDDAEVGAAAFLKAAELETVDPKKKLTYLVSAGDVYRAAYMTDKAIGIYKQVLGSDPGNTGAYYGIGLAAMGTPADDPAKQKEYWQTAADYLKAFLDKAPSDPRVPEVKATLDTLAKDYKIKPRPLK
jgi:tetratricopeptide (TPR) repeat protein